MQVEISDNELIDRLHNNDEEALTIVYKRYWELMYLAAYNLTKDHAVCEDMVQDVFVSFWQRRQRIQIKTSLRSYLYTSTVYRVYDYFRKNKKMVREELFQGLEKKVQVSNPETKLMYKELKSYIDGIVEELPPKCKEVYKLSREEQLSTKEIAQQLNISPRTVENHLSKALKVLRASLGMNLSLAFIAFLVS